MTNKVFKFTTYDADENEITHCFPGVNKMCGRCDGNGKVDHPAFSNGITESERYDMGEDEFENYRTGLYDVECSMCHGQKVVVAVNFKALTEDQKKIFNRWQEDQIEEASVRASEERWGY